MEYRQLPRGTAREKFSALGLGMGGIQKASAAEIEMVVRTALDHGINYFDLCAGAANVYAPFGRAIEGRRSEVFFQLHFGAVYNDAGEYGWSRDVRAIERTFKWEMKMLRTDYVDMGFLHCIDDTDDLNAMMTSGVADMVLGLKNSGVIKHIGFSSHTPEVAMRILDMGFADIMMFSINPAYDYETGGEFALGSVSERAELFRRCEMRGVGISVMKPFLAGRLLDASTSPFKKPLTRYQCLQYALDRPGVLSVLPGVRGMDDLEQLLGFLDSYAAERDYSQLGSLAPEGVKGTCVYCGHCRPCPAGIDIGLVNKYYDLALAGDAMAENHYGKLAVNASECVNCGHCTERCPFGVDQASRMGEIARWFGNR